jgi:cation:H+ antiporter
VGPALFGVVVGLVALVVGGDLLVRGASRLAGAFGVSPLVIGLTVVAYGTSSPELFVSLQAAWNGNADIAVANVVGSNIFNVLLILGVCAVTAPLVVASQIVKLDVPVMVASSLLVWAMALDGRIGTTEGALLATLLVAYTVYIVRASRRESAAVKEEFAEALEEREDHGSLAGAAAYAGAGLVVLALGSRWLINGAVVLAQGLGVSDATIGLTIVAAGTSLPELAASMVATWRGERDIAVGNVVGSNVYNLLLILGVASVATPGGLAVEGSLLAVDLPIMALVAVACVPIFWTGSAVSRAEGAAMLTAWAGYTGWLIAAA